MRIRSIRLYTRISLEPLSAQGEILGVPPPEYSVELPGVVPP